MPNLITEPEKIRLQEEGEVQAILGRPPGWLTRWGITFVLVGVTLLLILGMVLRYPDIVEAPAVILSADPPIRITAKSDVRVDHLWVDDRDLVDSGQLLLSFQSPAELPAIQTLRTEVERLIPAIRDRSIREIRLPQGLQLASLQGPYSALSELLDAQQFLLIRDDTQRRIEVLQRQLTQINRLNEVTDTVIDTLKQEVTIAKNNQETYLQLYQKGAASQQEYEEAKNNYLRYQRELQGKESDYARNELEAQIRQNQIITLSQDQNNEIKKGWRQLAESAQEMRASLEEWEATNLVKAPIGGEVIFADVWSDFQSVRNGQVILTIDPGPGDHDLTVRAKLPVAKSGKVRPGQEALLRLQAYPYKEFGVLEGQVSEIAPLPNPGESPFYHLQIELNSDSLITTSEKPIPFTQEMQATARIITDDRSFLGRVMDDLTSIFQKN
ncbi:HlyD family secretion protein [Flavilitoribacter nigricans]|uniref:AprE-like beta-barrel domain-containing protein n=1 Tax=Flavilitoribacter nigricans (strain ATCC 23147 / DSM 23189 / NBRC 102662 / NCIMB 1420 / SS-2) TaxID=1122177 RepID=A0A2D0MX38_FLAN2|nr:HlyD family efflux transporter periplasmic adaptor subunit [Flavilitoribacter nigricans]PHN00824.1 hypothetical protein CRP01_40270 [Flavilitoribacter nigricans DSM 23189 = NBRC 102662]